MKDFAALIPAESWQALVRAGSERSYAPGEWLLRQGDEADHVLLLMSGRVKVWRDEADGKRILLMVRWPRDLLGDRGVLGNGRRTATVEAIDPCLARRISVQRFQGLAADLNLAPALFRYMTGYLEEGELIRADRTVSPASRPVARYLTRLTEAALQHLARWDECPPEIDLGIGQSDLVDALGLTRQTVGIELRRLQENGIIRTVPGRIMVTDREGLAGFC